jgi:hypothetical protein
MTHVSDDDLLALRLSPARLGPLVGARRRELFGAGAAVIAIEPAHDPVLDAWPEPHAWPHGSAVVVHVADDDASRRAWVEWLSRVSESGVRGDLAPTGPEAAGLHKLWCIAAARLRLPSSVRVHVRHDLVGIRLTQIALGMGADVLSGPIEADRTLPLAGVTRPTETTRAGLHTLVRQAGLRAEGPPEPAPSIATDVPAPSAPEAHP